MGNVLAMGGRRRTFKKLTQTKIKNMYSLATVIDLPTSDSMHASRIDEQDLMTDMVGSSLVTRDQHAWQARRDERYQPEIKIMLAILEDAIDCIQKLRYHAHPRKRMEGIEAQTWMRSQDSKFLYSFERICEELKVDPNGIRRALELWSALKESGSNPPIIDFAHHNTPRGYKHIIGRRKDHK